MILTIGMIVKNEEKYLKACLDAISPILNQVESELIIADTGSDDSTVEIAKAFTDKVYHFKWCDDFSAARNSTIDRAQGEWYMFIDADEIFDNTEEIINFFQSGNYKHFQSATYIIRSFNDEQRKIYADIESYRLVKLSKATRFVNRVHESLVFQEPTKRLSSLANHFGYVTENNEEQIRAKSERNIELLVMELERQPRNSKYYLEIGQTYSMMGNLDRALEYFLKGLQCAKKQKFLEKFFYADIAATYYAMKQYAEVVEVVKEYFDQAMGKSEIDVQMYFAEANSLFILKKYKEAITIFQDYIKAYHRYHKGYYQTKDIQIYTVKYTDAFNFRVACMNMVSSCLEVKDYATAHQYIKYIPILDWNRDASYLANRLALELNLMTATEDFSGLPQLMKSLNVELHETLYTTLEPLLTEERIRQLAFEEIIKADLPQQDYVILIKLRQHFYGGHILPKTEIISLISGIQKWTPLYADAIYIALFEELDISFVANTFQTDELDRLLFSSRYLHFKDLPELICKILERDLKNESAETLWFLTVLSKWALCANHLEEEKLRNLFLRYSDIMEGYLTAAYKNNIIKEENISLFPIEVQIGYFCVRAVKHRGKGEDHKYIEMLKSVLNLCPEMNEVIKLLLADLQKKLDAANRNARQNEFEQYALIIKQDIRRMIDGGQLAQADKLLHEFEQLCPEDQELVELKKKITTPRH